MADELTPDQARRILDALTAGSTVTPEQLRGIERFSDQITRPSAGYKRRLRALAPISYWDNFADAVARGTAAARDEEPTARPPATPVPRPPLPNPSQLKSYTHGTLEKAVRQLNEGETPGDVVRGATRAKMPRPDARRVLALWRGGLLRLNADNKLLVDERIPSKVVGKTSRYVLRYLDDAGTGWVDPNREPPKP